MRVDAAAALLAFIALLSLAMQLSLKEHVARVTIYEAVRGSVASCRVTLNLTLSGSEYLYEILNASLAKVVCPPPGG